MSKADVAAERKEQIVKATVDCITKYGYHNFSMQDVARNAGVSKGIIHYYFLNKDELMMSVLESVSSDIERLLQEDMESIKDPVKKIEVFIKGCFEVVRTTKEYYQVSMDFWTQINQKEQVKIVISAHYQKFRDKAAAVIQEGIDAGAFKKVNPLHFAAYTIAVVDGISIQWLFDEETFDYNAMSSMAIDLLVNSLKA